MGKAQTKRDGEGEGKGTPDSTLYKERVRGEGRDWIFQDWIGLDYRIALPDCITGQVIIRCPRQLKEVSQDPILPREDHEDRERKFLVSSIFQSQFTFSGMLPSSRCCHEATRHVIDK